MRLVWCVLAGAFGIVLMSLFYTHTVSADSISIAPLQYKTTLEMNEDKKGYVDVLNPEPRTITVQLKTQAFRHTDDKGSLQFYDSEAIARGVKLDLTEIELGPNEGARIFFLLDASELPSGDVFAAILATTALSDQSVMSVPSAQVGTLLLITNGTPPKHTAAVTKLSANWLQIGSGITANIAIKNTNTSDEDALGFIPTLNFDVTPYSKQTVDGPLIFSDKTRVVDYVQRGDYFGPALIKASVQDSSQTQLVFAITGYWRWLAPLLLFVIIVLFAGISIGVKRRRKNRK